MSFASVSIRGSDVYRVRPEQGRGLCQHSVAAGQDPKVRCVAGGICPPVLTRNHAVYGGLDGKLYCVPLDGGETSAFATAFGAPISAPVAVADGRVLVACEDGYVYIFGPDGQAALPEEDLGLWKIRSPLSGPWADAEFDWYTNYGDFSGTNANDQGLAPPLQMRWVRRLAGTVKHLPVCGGGRMYLHTAEGQILAVEQDTGRLLWRRYWPDVYLSFTSPLYLRGKLIVPQAGIKRSRMRCLDAATGKLLWEVPFTGSPSWSRQFPPVVHENVVIYASGSGEYAPQGTEESFVFRGTPVERDGREVMSWIYSNDNPYYPKDHHPRIWAWDLETGKLLWEKDFSEFGRGGNDCGICLHQGKLYYSVFFGYSANQRRRRGLPVENNGLTACLEPTTGRVLWQTNQYYVTSKCTLSARDGRIYLGGYNRATEGTEDRFVWCLNAEDGSLQWKSDPVTSALNVVTVGQRYIFSNALRGQGNVFDARSGQVTRRIGHNYACCRFTLSEPFVLGANMDMIDLSADGKLVSTGPAIDSRECLARWYPMDESSMSHRPADSSSRKHTVRHPSTCRRSGHVRPPGRTREPRPGFGPEMATQLAVGVAQAVKQGQCRSITRASSGTWSGAAVELPRGVGDQLSRGGYVLRPGSAVRWEARSQSTFHSPSLSEKRSRKLFPS